MNILAIESSCDEFAAAVVRDGREILAQVVNSQIDIHKAFGGVVPEIAARSHLETAIPVVDECLAKFGGTWDDIDAIAVTSQPGLVGSLLIGTLTARILALVKNKPLYAVHHVEGHVYANFLMEKQPEFPCLALIVSGGHSQLVLFRNHGDYELLGQTIDDAVGEAFDKVAKILGLPYPGGPSVSLAAENGDETQFNLPDAKLKGDENKYNFSFSGLKTAVLRTAQTAIGKDHTFPSFELSVRLSHSQKNDIAASFQSRAVKTLLDKTKKAVLEFSPKSVVLAGGVAANKKLRDEILKIKGVKVYIPDFALCTDNAAMIGALAFYMSQKVEPTDPKTLEVLPSVSMKETKWA